MSKGDATRERIVVEAAALFNEHGLEGTSLSALMQATGLEKGGIYRHFSSKEDIALEAFDYAWQAAFEVRTHDLGAISNSVDKLKQYVANFVERRSPVPGGCPLLNTAIEADDGNPALRDRARKALGEWRAALQSIVAAGLKRGEIRPGTDAATLTNLVIACLEGALMMSRLERSREPLLSAKAHLEGYLETQVRQGKSAANRARRK